MFSVGRSVGFWVGFLEIDFKVRIWVKVIYREVKLEKFMGSEEEGRGGGERSLEGRCLVRSLGEFGK